MNSAFRDIIVLKDYDLIKAVGLAILVSMIGFSILSMTGAITINPVPFFWGALMLGGFVFGIGMVVAGGCASGITYRFGEGMVGAMSAVVGLILVGLMTTQGVFQPLNLNHLLTLALPIVLLDSTGGYAKQPRPEQPRISQLR